MPRRAFIACTLLLLAALAAAYVGGLSAPLVFDDHEALTDNPHVHSALPWVAAGAPEASPLAGRPVVALSFALDHLVHGLAPLGLHLVNLLLHAACALLLVDLLRAALRQPRCPDRVRAAADGLALATAGLWALHPLATDAVQYLTQRTELLVTLAWLATCRLALLGFDAERTGRPDQARRAFAGAVAVGVLGMACKENMIGAPLFVLLLDRAFGAGSLRAAWRTHRGLHAGLFAGWVVLAACVAAGGRSQSVGFAHGISPWEALLTQSGVLAHYLRLSFWPDALCFVYDWPVARGLAEVAAPLLLVGSLLLLAALLLRRAPAAALPAALLFLVLAPTTSLLPIPTELAAERRMYLPLAALLLPAVLLAHRALAGRARALLAAALLAALSAETVATAQRVRLWNDVQALWLDAAVKSPGYYAFANLGLLATRAGEHEAAEAWHLAAVERVPHFAPAWIELGNARIAAGNVAGAEAAFREALTLAPDNAAAHHNLALVLAREDRLDEAITELREALRLQPSYVDANANLAVLLVAAGRPDEAAAPLEAALRMAPSHPQALALLVKLRGEG